MEPLFLDNHLLVLDKPWGLLTQPSGTTEPSLEEQGKAFLKEHFAKPGAVFLEAVHRIDRVVGGVVLFARTSKALERLNAAQREKRITKVYHARVWGVPKNTEGTLEDYLVHDDFHARVVPPGTPEARLCKLNYKVMGAKDGTALLEIGLETGRYHQIRTQLAHAGWPICGDTKYGAPNTTTKFAPNNGIALVSYAIIVPHPVSKEVTEIHSKLMV